MAKSYDLTLGTVSVDASDTDGDLLQKAIQLLPEALHQFGEKAGEDMWNTAQKTFGSSSFIQLQNSSSDRAKFIRETADEYVRVASQSDKDSLTNTILEQLMTHRDSERKKFNQS